jgi:hypothetical protein
MPPRHQLHGEMVGPLRHAVGVVALRQADKEAGRADADLAGEPDQTAGGFVADASRDDIHRIVEQRRHPVERIRSVHRLLHR